LLPVPTRFAVKSRLNKELSTAELAAGVRPYG
jgi:hypothetical protein